MDNYHTIHQWDGDVSLSTTIITALATVQGTDPTELEPLHSVVDTAALNTVVESLHNSTHSNGEECVEFTVDGYRVTATSSGDVTVQSHRTTREDGGVMDEETFQVALTELVREAVANGVDVEGGWSCGDRSDESGLSMEIYEVDRRTSM